MRALPSIDMHAHIDAAIDPSELTALDALVFAACRTLDEAEIAFARTDAFTVWGTGCHPGLVGAQKAFNVERFREQVLRTPYVAELGLDGKSRVPIDMQKRTLRSAFDVLTEHPRITSLHSYAATEELIDLLEQYKLQGVVLHWWLGNEELTARAIELGCYFSLNSSSIRNGELLRPLPLDRLLPETDHPFGNRTGAKPRRPGQVSDIEARIASSFKLAVEEVRAIMWRNLAEIVRSTRVGGLMPDRVRVLLLTL